MRLRFVGEYTNGRTSLVAFGVTFEGHEPTEVTPDVAVLFEGHSEFETVGPLDHDGDGKPGGSPKGEQSTVRRGRRKGTSQ